MKPNSFDLTIALREFIERNRPKLSIKLTSGMLVESRDSKTFFPIDLVSDMAYYNNHVGVDGVWLVDGKNKNKITQVDGVDGFEGYMVENCCGTFTIIKSPD